MILPRGWRVSLLFCGGGGGICARGQIIFIPAKRRPAWVYVCRWGGAKQGCSCLYPCKFVPSVFLNDWYSSGSPTQPNPWVLVSVLMRVFPRLSNPSWSCPVLSCLVLSCVVLFCLVSFVRCLSPPKIASVVPHRAQCTWRSATCGCCGGSDSTLRLSSRQSRWGSG